MRPGSKAQVGWHLQHTCMGLLRSSLCKVSFWQASHTPTSTSWTSYGSCVLTVLYDVDFALPNCYVSQYAQLLTVLSLQQTLHAKNM